MEAQLPEGLDPFAEDRFKVIRIGGLTLRVVKPCARCATTTVNQTTAETGHEPLTTLATFRKFDGKVLFAQNLIHSGIGTIRVGDRVEVLERK